MPLAKPRRQPITVAPTGRSRTHLRAVVLIVVGLTAVVGGTGCTWIGGEEDGAPADRLASRAVDADAVAVAEGAEGAEGADSTVSSLASPAHLGSYTVDAPGHATATTVTIEGATRIITTNAVPDHEVGPFGGRDIPEAVSAQALTFRFTTRPVLTDGAMTAQPAGVAVNGVPFEPATAETVVCASGETYRLEALQNIVEFGVDPSRGAVRADGRYHYLGLPAPLVRSAGATAENADLVHVGFAADGFLIYASRSGVHHPSYQLRPGTRAGVQCLRGDQAIDVAGTTPDGTYTSDWVFEEGSGDLDRCNGIVLGDEYVYLLTEGFPYVPRCLNGDGAAISAGLRTVGGDQPGARSRPAGG